MATNMLAQLPTDTHAALTTENIDRIDELLSQALGIVDIAGHADRGAVSDDSLLNACWAVEKMLREVKSIVHNGAINRDSYTAEPGFGEGASEGDSR